MGFFLSFLVFFNMSIREKMTGTLLLILGLVSFISMSKCKDQQVKTATVEGHAFLIFCETDQDSDNLTVTWTKDNYTLNTTPRIRIQGRSLWFLSTISSDSGLYICKSGTNSTVSKEFRVYLSVEAGPCPRSDDDEFGLPGTNVNLSCTEENVPTLGETLQVQWYKECKPTGVQGSEFIIFNLSLSNTGYYTCLVGFRYEGKDYTASHTIHLKVLEDEPVEKPRIIYPQNTTLYVKPAVEIKLECNVIIGSREEEIQETSIYWMLNQSFINSYPQLQENQTIKMKEDGKIHGSCTLLIPKVSPEFIGVPFQCVVLSPSGMDMGLLWLIQDDNTTTTILLIAVPLILVVIVAILLTCFKIDIILCYHHLSGKSKVTNQQGKLYDAYVSYLHGNSPGSSAAKELALRILPKVLEHKHNLRLFIRGRDDSGTVNIAEMSDVLSQTKTVVLILPGLDPVSPDDENLIMVSQGEDNLDDLQITDFFSAITQSGLPVILVESEKNVDYSLLPEPIQSIKRKYGLLRWKQTARPNGRFWKQLRYRMI